MNHTAAYVSALTLVAFLCAPMGAVTDVRYLGKVEISGTATDLSGDAAALEDGTPSNRLGAFGSAITWTGKGNSYVALPDRGPADGATSYKTRLQSFDITIVPKGRTYDIKANLTSTVMLTNLQGQNLTGKSDAPTRLDPEGICISQNGTVYVSDEYGPDIYEFGLDGKELPQKISVPARFHISKPRFDPKEELKLNKFGRQPNRGMEGLTISLDGKYLFGIMQSPLIQDGGVDSNYKRVGTNIRILRIDLETGRTTECLYALDSPAHGVNEIAAVSSDKCLVIERDGHSGRSASFKMIYQIDFAGASDISGIDSLPATSIPSGVMPVRKRAFIDLLDAEFGLAGESFPEKIEGIALGPALPDVGRLLLISSDNDFAAGVPSELFVFSISK